MEHNEGSLKREVYYSLGLHKKKKTQSRTWAVEIMGPWTKAKAEQKYTDYGLWNLGQQNPELGFYSDLGQE